MSAGGRADELIERALRIMAGALAGVGAAALAGIFLLVLAAVVMRYIWGRPFGFTEELSGLLMTLAVFTLLPSTVLGEINIRVTVLSERLPAVEQRLLFVLGQVLLLVFCAVFVREAWGIYEFTAKLGLLSEQSRLPLAPFLLIGTLAVAAAGVAGAWRAVRPTRPHSDEAVHA
jgi:TRAP-type C4-dicarboxylate transport system permease small subunit